MSEELKVGHGASSVLHVKVMQQSTTQLCSSIAEHLSLLRFLFYLWQVHCMVLSPCSNQPLFLQQKAAIFFSKISHKLCYLLSTKWFNNLLLGKVSNLAAKDKKESNLTLAVAQVVINMIENEC